MKAIFSPRPLAGMIWQNPLLTKPFAVERRLSQKVDYTETGNLPRSGKVLRDNEKFNKRCGLWLKARGLNYTFR